MDPQKSDNKLAIYHSVYASPLAPLLPPRCLHLAPEHAMRNVSQF